MTTRDFTANVISATKVVPDGNFKTSAASGVWDINEALDLIKGGNWPNAANIDPAAFVDNLFSTFVYEGNGSSKTITNNIDLSSKGGLVWMKARSTAESNILQDTDGTGVGYALIGNSSSQMVAISGTHLSAFNSNGFTIGTSTDINRSGTTMASWTFRKAPKFFDIQTWTGNGTAGRTISHDLGSDPGMVIIKRTDSSQNWIVHHRSLTSTKYLALNLTNGEINGSDVTATSSTNITLSDSFNTNGSSATYVGYFFAHNNSDGGFGEPGDQDIIKCGSYTGNGSTNGVEIDLGFEPQFVIVKRTDSSAGWFIMDTMRGMSVGNGATGNTYYVNSNNNNAEDVFSSGSIDPTPTGFNADGTNTNINASSGNYIYMAIRRGGMQTPTAAADVFDITTRASTTYNGPDPDFSANHLVDMVLFKDIANASSSWTNSARLIDGYRLIPNGTDAEGSSSFYSFNYMNGWGNSANGADTDDQTWMWKRARGYFDVVTYTGNGVQGRNVTHNLGVAPDMMWVKQRSTSFINGDWEVYVSGITALSVNGSDPDNYGDNPPTLRLNTTAAPNFSMSGTWDHTHPTSSVFRVGDTYSTNRNGDPYIAYLFATLAGVSKVGSFTQSGATNVDCGFTGDTPSFILLKRTDSTGDWLVFDSARGIVAGNDNSLDLNNTDAEVTSADVVDPYSGGFATTSSLTNGNYIFYAIAATS